jgi:hypothetical protein
MKHAGLVLMAVAIMTGCGGEAPVEPTASLPAPEVAAPADAAAAAPAAMEAAVAPATEAVATGGKDVGGIVMFDLPAITIGAYTVQAMYEDKLEDGHFNLRITGGDVAAVREWVGPEDASGVMVVKTEIERDYWHGHVEMPNPIPADARLWIEIETPAGELLKGSTTLK